MKLLLAIIFVLSSSLALAEEVETDCPWADQSSRTSGKSVSSSSTKSKTKGATVKGE